MNGSKFIIVTVLVLSILIAPVYAKSEIVPDPQLFPRSKMIDVQVFFWKKIFSEVKTTEVLIHDRELVLPIHEKVSVIGLTRKQAKSRVKERSRQIKKQLRLLADTLEKKSPLNPSQKKILNKFYKGVTPKQLRKAAQRLRSQYGVADRFREGLVRSGSYMNFILRALKNQGVPPELAYLPHVESSFNFTSHSKSGAKGIWQFTRSTGKMFMRVNSRVDERLDPFISSLAAAKLLKANYEHLGSWPLAITAYNHGPNGISKIAKKLKTRDLGYMIRHYNSRTFGFASKNFYAEFLAAAEVAGNYQKYFGALKLNPPLRYKEIRLPKSMSIRTVMSRLNYPRKQVLALNPALNPRVLSGHYHVPSYYRIKVPISGLDSEKVAQINMSGGKSDSISNRKKQGRHSPKWVTVKRGDSLSTIADRYNMSVKNLVSLNNVSPRKYLYPGQVLRVSNGRNATEVIVKRGDSLTTIARQNRVSLHQLLAANDLNFNSIIFPGQELKLPGGKEFSAPQKRVLRVTVRRGDTLYEIARRAGIHIDELTSINGLSKSSVIYPGQRLILSL
ncbi:MAG: LysM peptidoglycan-binding domain-containing protein [SAR324 cluster bacterium]|nr:LysM peptidoglycan-binding domain-containing protein [SAR324 cluster bacterium]